MWDTLHIKVSMLLCYTCLMIGIPIFPLYIHMASKRSLMSAEMETEPMLGSEF
jgi:hypothetical protein